MLSAVVIIALGLLHPAKASAEPFITAQTSTTIIKAGGSANLSISAEGTPPLTYQWYAGNTGDLSQPIPLATSANFTSPLLYRSARYWVRVTNGISQADSDTLFVVTKQDSDQTIISATDYNSLFIKANRDLWGADANSVGQLGLGNFSTTLQPPTFVTDSTIAVAAAYQHTLFIKTDGTLWGMGANNFGQLGTGNFTRQLSPVQIAAQIVSASAKGRNSVFLKSDGTLWTMGSLQDGRLNPISINTPIQIAANVASASAGYYHNLFIKTDGTLWAIGLNRSGELGDNTTTSRTQPVLVATDVVAAEAGAYFSLFLKSDGSLWAMGNNSYGQLGDGTTTEQHIPVQVANGVVEIAAGAIHTLFLKANGDLWSVGAIAASPVFTYIKSTSAYKVSEQVVAFSGGAAQTLYLKADGTLWDVGAIFRPPVDRTTPVQMADGLAHAPFVTIQPQGAALNPGDTTNLTVTALGTGNLSYQWYEGETGDTSQPVLNATTANFTTPSSLSTGTRYWVRVSNNAGTAYSDAVSVLIAPDITVEPANFTIANGNTALLSITPSDASGVTYQWYLGVSGDTSQPVEGATNDTFTTPALSMDATYWVRLTNAAGHTDSGTFTVNVAPAIIIQPVSQVVKAGTTVKFIVTAAGGTPLQYQWRFKNLNLGGAVAAMLTLKNVTIANNGVYTVVVSNSTGKVTSAGATLIVDRLAPKIIVQPFSLSVRPGQSAKFIVKAAGDAPLKYQWQHNGAPLTDLTNLPGSTTISGAGTPTLTLTKINVGGDGNYRVVITNAAGSATSTTVKLTLRTGTGK